MNDELPVPKSNEASLDARFAKRPHAYARLRQIADMMDQAELHRGSLRFAPAARLAHPQASQHAKKK